MEKWSFREQVLLGYNSRDSIGNRSFSVNASPQIPYRNSNANRRALDSMDFNDVFGGPPRRCSFVRDSRYSLNEAIGGDPVLFKEEALQSQGSELREKPVFGGDGPKCKNHLGEDFFGDIFGGEDSSRMPRRKSRGPFGSLPASRMVSPVIPSRPYSETFSGGSSLPPELSLPSKLGKRIDYPAFDSASGSHSPNKHKQDASNPSGFSSSPSVLSPKMTAFDNNNSKFQTHLVQGLDDSRNGARTLYRQSPLSNQFSLNCDDGSSEATESARPNSEKPDSDNEFHFSIHKWASKGITLLMPAKGGNLSKDRDTKVTKAGLPPKAVFPGADNSPKYENPSIISRDPKTKENCLQQETKLPSISSSSTLGNVEKVVPASPQASRRPGLKSLHSLFKVNSVDSSRSDNNLPKVIGNEVPVSVQEECKSELKIHDNLPIDKADEQGKETIVGQAGGIEGKPLSNILPESIDDGRKVKSTRKNTQKNVETTSPTLRDLTLNSETRVPGNSVNGKVKEFVKMFNQEASQKSTHKVDIKSHSSRVKESEAHKVEDQISISTVKLVEEEKMVNGNRNTASTDAHAPVAAVDIWRETENADLDIDFTVHHVEDSLSETIEISLPCFESIPESFGNKVNNIEESCYGNLQKHCPVEKIPEEQKQHPQMDQDQELQSYDSNIQNWSRGKEGNIRSLLSTLQYVLWPNSGWKPIALMDIIEGNSVKRAYQKALLCLHPDKLQQKGVTVLQKHIAEKVFEILQEAWSQFNSIDTF